MRILVIEDDAQAAAFVVKGLTESGHVVDHAADGKDGLFLAGAENYDVLIVDRMLPGRDGLSLIELLRATGNDTPALILSALASVDDRVRGLRAGGDDYLTKPYAFSELLARVEVLGRRRTAGPAARTRIEV
ncbi:MAG TPA: response regulator, partial [Arenibaculum sp.]|nr:response regulator [Arenibaculum sp.]